MRIGCGGGFVRSDDFSLPVNARSVFCGTWSRDCAPSCESSGPPADLGRVERIEFAGKMPDFAVGDFAWVSPKAAVHLA